MKPKAVFRQIGEHRLWLMEFNGKHLAAPTLGKLFDGAHKFFAGNQPRHPSGTNPEAEGAINV